MTAIANWMSFLQSDNARRPQDGPPAQLDPTQRVLAVLRNASMMPVTDIVRATALSPADALAAVETLRGSQRLEVVIPTGGSVPMLRLTPAGYAVAAELPTGPIPQS